MKELVLSIVSITALAVMIGYFIRQSIWTRWILPMIQRKPKPKVLFSNGMDVIHVCQPAFTDVDELVRQSMAEEIKQHPRQQYEEPSYENMGAFLQGSVKNKRIYNDLLTLYLKKKEEAYSHIHKSEYEDSLLIPIKLMLKNTGNVPCKKLKVTVTPDNMTHLYFEDARTLVKATCMKPPIYAGENCFPPLNSGVEEYQYVAWDFSKHMSQEISVHQDFLHQHDVSDRLPLLYVDSRQKGKILLDWEIIEENISSPVTGELVLWVD